MLENNDQEIDSPQDLEYAKGFNNGWLIATHEPELSTALVVSLQRIEPPKENVYAEGIKEGILYHEFEKAKNRYKGTQSPDRGIDKNKDKGRSKE